MTRGVAEDVYISAGSNIEPVKNLRMACRELEQKFGSLSMSSVYQSAPVGFDGDDFLNVVISFATTQSIGAITVELERLHDLAGRFRSANSLSSRALDLDMLLYGTQIIDVPPVSLPRDDVTRYAFVLAPMAELAPTLRHPVTGETMQDLWRRFDRAKQPIQLLAESPL